MSDEVAAVTLDAAVDKGRRRVLFRMNSGGFCLQMTMSPGMLSDFIADLKSLEHEALKALDEPDKPERPKPGCGGDNLSDPPEK